MSNFVSIKITITSDLHQNLSEFFHLDAEILHPDIDDAQILSFDQESKSCIAELFIGDMSKEDFQKSIDIKKPSLSINNYEIDYIILDLV